MLAVAAEDFSLGTISRLDNVDKRSASLGTSHGRRLEHLQDRPGRASETASVTLARYVLLRCEAEVPAGDASIVGCAAALDR